MTDKRITPPLPDFDADAAITSAALRIAGLKSQKFFDDLRVAARSPGYGDHHRQFVTNLLLRATEAGIYTPEAT